MLAEMIEQAPRRNPLLAFSPILALVGIAFLVTGMALPVLPLYVHQVLGYGAFGVGLIIGAQFGASLISRPLAGRFSDRRGAKLTMLIGLLCAYSTGVCYFLTFGLQSHNEVAFALLLAGRGLLGVAESFIMISAQSWGIALAGPRFYGRVIAWAGMAMYLALALGAPLGTLLYEKWGFRSLAFATLLLPAAGALIAFPMATTKASAKQSPPFAAMFRSVRGPGVGLALASVGYGTVIAFSALLFSQKGWPTWLPLTGFAVFFILARLLFGHMTDTIGGAKIALIFSLIECVGQFLLGLGMSLPTALVGCAMSGFGYSLVYPGFGVEAARRAPNQSAGYAMGLYTAFLDLTLGLAGPALGAIGQASGLVTIFILSAITVGSSSIVALRLRPSALTRR